MEVTGYAYAWDVLRDPGFADRVHGLGIDQVAVATAYHATRAGTPWLAGQSAMLAPEAALYRPLRASAWRHRRLRPLPASWLPEPDSAGDAIRRLRSSGLRAVPWIVLTHNDALGTSRPDVTVRNCFGEAYPWALCPASEEVREFAATLAAESVRDLDPDAVILESCGQMGVTHLGGHEKTDAIWAPAVRRLLSVCCCPSCATGWSRAGLDPDAVRTMLRDRVRALIASANLDAIDDGLPADVSAAVLAERHRSADLLRAAVFAALGRRARVTLHGSADPWATGPLPGLRASGVTEVATVVVKCWEEAEGEAKVRRARESLPGPANVGAYVTVVSAAPPGAIGEYVTRLAAAAASELHLYHLGLAGPARLPLARAAAEAAKNHLRPAVGCVAPTGFEPALPP